MGRTACTEPQCLYSRAIPLFPLWAYGLYRASVPVQGCTLPLPFFLNKSSMFPEVAPQKFQGPTSANAIVSLTQTIELPLYLGFMK